MRWRGMKWLLISCEVVLCAGGWQSPGKRTLAHTITPYSFSLGSSLQIMGPKVPLTTDNLLSLEADCLVLSHSNLCKR